MDMKTQEWYRDPVELAGAIAFLMKYHCCFDWNVYTSDKTPCCDYREVDASVPDGLREAIRSYISGLPRAQRQELKNRVCSLLGERFYVKDATVVKIFSRLLADGNIRHDRQALKMIALSLTYKAGMCHDLLSELVGDVKGVTKKGA